LHILFYIVLILTCSLCNKNDDDDDDEVIIIGLHLFIHQTYSTNIINTIVHARTETK